MIARSPKSCSFIKNATALFLCVCCFCLSAGKVLANPFEDTVRILEERTSFHWGRDCFVWIVHYTEDLVDPWVNAEAGRAGMSDSEREVYRKNFVAELKLGSAEPFLFSVYSFGARPVAFAPFSEKVALVTSSGERLKPIRYDARLDQPISGLIQGLVFFPKQSQSDFAVAVQGMGVYDERLFAFGAQSAYEPVASKPFEEDIPVVVVDLPPASEKVPASKKSSRPALKPQSKTEPLEDVIVPRIPASPVSSAPVSEELDMTAFVQEMRLGKNSETASDDASQETENAYVSREKTMKNFLDLWIKQKPELMYGMLSETSKKLFTVETFAAELKKAAEFRAAIKDGYKIEWIGDDRAKITAIKRVLMIRSLVGRTLGVVREKSSWKIVW